MGFFGRNSNREAAPATTSRIPALLQSVFISSNRGKEVNKPPPERMAQKTYNGNLNKKGQYTQNKKMYQDSKDKVLSKNNKHAAEHLKRHEEKKAAELAKQQEAVKAMPEEKELTLQEHFDKLVKERNLDIPTYETLKTAYNNKASELQMASYGPRMVAIVKSSDVPALRETLSVGLSPNPCNQFGESLLHMVCRRGDADLLQVMIDAGTMLQVSDDYGRTPLHDACWAAKPAFDVVKKILEWEGFMFFMKDRRGALPLSYVHKDHTEEWKAWLDANIDTFLPAGSTQPEFCLARMEANSMPLPDVKSELSLELIKMVASGDMSPREARLMAEVGDEPTVAGTVMDDESDSEFDSDYDSDYDSEYDSDDSEFSMEEDEVMMEMLAVSRCAF